ncbi:hypothetical protein R50345_07370 [Paenibacillus sp. FSL R5-0345]|uniref:Uncharacterized protein n=2 Tax=Paenibacillus TaxID=44249 RepID=A0A1R0Y1C7_9BACL|nr:hypothetical protein [Paenibacillus sp. FSL R5-0345]AIQ34450.1 hypothetical protein R50345_07370 [Paenibacillus sp. FSL R5-0345]OMD41164.1 hypothetical protein BSK52_12115 [Paenibacillus odorifer]
MQMVNKCGTTVNEYSYDEWGNNTSQTEGIEEPAGCNARGKEWNRSSRQGANRLAGTRALNGQGYKQVHQGWSYPRCDPLLLGGGLS